MAENSDQIKRYKRKRKKNFLKNAKKYGKKGYYGRGNQLDSETYDYLVRIMEVYKEGFPSEDEKSMFINNVFRQIENQEVTCCCNQLGCRVVQMLLPFASNEIIETYMDGFVSDLRPLCSDRFASHVLQTLVEICFQKSSRLEVEDGFKIKCHETALKICKFLLNNLEDFIWDTYGNHVIRTICTNLSQLPSTTTSEDVKREINKEHAEILEDYAQRLVSWPQFKEFPYSEVTSGFLQVMLKSLANINSKMLSTYIKKLSDECFVGEDADDENKCMPNVFMSKPAIMVMETALKVAPSKLYTQIYVKHFVNNLSKLAIGRNTNFAVQKLISHCKEKVEFEAIFDELSESFSEIIGNGHSGVILALGQACKRLSAKQGSFVQHIMKAFDCYEPEDHQLKIVLCLCKLSKVQEIDHKSEDLEKAKLNLHGTLIVQLLLEFNKPIKIVNSILNMETTVLKCLFSNSMGSHIIDSFVKSKFVGEKSRDKLIKKLQGTYQDLASLKYGSRSFEAVWNVASLKSRGYIMNELVQKDGAWSNSEFGRIIASKVNLNLYKRNKDEWNSSFNKVSKTQSLFADIIND